MNENYKERKSIIIYFSRADENYSVGYITKGNTEVIAEYIKDLTNADMFKVESLNPYAKDYQTAIEEAKRRQSSHDAPIINELPDLSEYEVIYLGSPVYWSYMPEELVTALKNKNYIGKFIRPFITHEGSGQASIPNQIKEICSGATVTDAFVVYGSSVNSAREAIKNWI